MVANQSKCSSLEQQSVINFLVVEKSKPCEIYRRMCDVYIEKQVLVKKKKKIIHKWHI